MSGRRDPGGVPAVDTELMEVAAAIAAQFCLHAAGGVSAAKLVNAAPFQYAPTRRPGANPTNDESEHMPRKTVVTAGRIRFGIAGVGCARMFSNIMTCVLTWRKRNPGVSDMLLKVLGGT